MQRAIRERGRAADARPASRTARGVHAPDAKPRTWAGWRSAGLAVCGGLLLLFGGGSAAGDAGTTVAPTAPPRVSGERRARAQAWLGDPAALIDEHLPGAETAGVCMVSSDCAAGFECVVAGFEGHCVKQ